MTSERIAVPYNHKLKRLEALLAGVQRAGDFFVQGSLDAPIPRVEVDGVGVLSFPVPAVQIEAVVKRAHRAPCGRGDHTIVDTSVRNAWQIDSADVRIGGKAWEKTFHQIMSTVIAGLGCSGMNVLATLYKLLVYETGGLSVRIATPKRPMACSVPWSWCLPSAHGGGDLIIRHATREVSVNLSSPDVSELRFAAFYADCEHEVRPITQGSRVCLTYNLSLVNKRKKRQQAALLGARRSGELLSNLVRAHMPSRRRECVDLLSRLVHEQDHALDSAWLSGLRNLAAAIIETLPKRQKRPAASDLDDGLGRPHDTRRTTASDVRDRWR
ncbi:MAG: hypothetical protein K2Y23_19095 [Cyanobacteria bacterium]|nr:hypothetical protein [Cyanobacteriota bacterium]